MCFGIGVRKKNQPHCPIDDLNLGLPTTSAKKDLELAHKRTLRTSGQLTNSGRLFMSTAITTLWNDVTQDEAAIYGLDSERHIAA